MICKEVDCGTTPAFSQHIRKNNAFIYLFIFKPNLFNVFMKWLPSLEQGLLSFLKIYPANSFRVQ